MSRAGTPFSGTKSPSRITGMISMGASVARGFPSDTHACVDAVQREQSISVSSLLPLNHTLQTFFSLTVLLLSLKSRIAPAPSLPSCLGQFRVLISHELAAQIPYEAPDPLRLIPMRDLTNLMLISSFSSSSNYFSLHLSAKAEPTPSARVLACVV